MAQVVVTAIHNRTEETLALTDPEEGRLEVGPGMTLWGPFTYTYDPEAHGQVPQNHEPWYVESPSEFQWGTFDFPDPEQQRIP